MPEAVEPRDLDLMRRLAAGDEAAFLTFYRRHQGAIFRYALHMAGRPDAAADVVQETFLTLLRQAKKFDESKGAPAAFLYGIARNHLRKLYEKESRYVPLNGNREAGDGPAAGYSHNGQRASGEASSGISGGFATNGNESPWHNSNNVLDELEQGEMVQHLRDAILTLPEHYRDPVTLCDLGGKSYADAADVLQCPVGTVRSRLNRARSMLLEKMRPLLGDRAASVRSGGKA